MNDGENIVNSSERFWMRLGILIVAGGLGVIGLAYVVIALQINSGIPNSPIWPKLYETAFAIGWILMAVGVTAFGLNFKKSKDEAKQRN